MIKKISAILLALVLCLSVVVVPASAAVELGDAQMAFSLEWDKEYYSAGDTATLSVYIDAADDLTLYTGSFIIGLNSAVISQADNPIADVKANSTTDDTFRSFYKGADTQLSWLATSIATRVDTANTAEEQALYDHYLKYTVSKDTAGGWHENSGDNKTGFNGTDFDPSVPICTISFVIADGVADGTAVNAAITSGSLTCNPVQTTWKYYSNPGNATTAPNITAANFDISQTVATSTIGEPAAPSPLVATTSQIRYQMTADGAYNNAVDVRTRATIAKADWDVIFGGKTDDEIVSENLISNVGFVYASNSVEFSVADAQQVAQGTAVSGYTNKPVSHIQSTGDGYIFTCLVTDITDANLAAGDGMTAYAYMQVGDTWYFYDAATTVLFKDLYNTYNDSANNAFGWSLADIA